ncbi:VWA domain-containing protein [Candidatus Babeliales bacterium]|nr:VWA domain-containing protein [Candidatus Babeliales bacterium]MBY0352806.1 VWA domain-containing protein [Candidatus Babeliales bacterium]
MTDLFGIHWAGADKLLYAPVFVLFIFLVIRNYVRIRRSANVLVHSANRKTVFANYSGRKQLIKTLSLCTALVLLFLALLQPQWGKKEHTVVQEGRDLLMVLDVSRSMLAQDFKPSRLEFAKLKVRNLLAKLNFERVGLILFSGSAFMQCPLTIDHAAFLMFLDHVDAEVISSGTTAIDVALQKAMEVYAKSTGRKNKNVLLVTDGEDFSTNLAGVKSKALEQNIRVFALGVGSTEGAPIPIIDAHGNQVGHEKDEKGGIALSALNEKLLQQICMQLHGSYVKASYDDSDIDGIARQIQQLEKEKFMDQKISQYEDQYPWLLAGAWLLFLLEWLI